MFLMEEVEILWQELAIFFFDFWFFLVIFRREKQEEDRKEVSININDICG